MLVARLRRYLLNSDGPNPAVDAVSLRLSRARSHNSANTKTTESSSRSGIPILPLSCLFLLTQGFLCTEAPDLALR
jgi:hypothetical protein